MTGRLTVGSMTRGRVRRFGATTAAVLGLRSVATAIPGRRSDAMTVHIHRDHRGMARVVPMSAGMVRREEATDRRTRREVVIGRHMEHEGATVPHMQVEAAATGLVRHFGATTAAGGPRFVETTGRTRRARRVTPRVEGRSAGMDRREVAIGHRMHHEGAVRGRLRPGHVALDLVVRVEITNRGLSGTRAIRSRVVVAGPSQPGVAVVGAYRDLEAVRRSGPDRLGARVQGANAVVMAAGQAEPAEEVGLAEARRVATAHPGGTATQEAMRDRRAGR